MASVRQLEANRRNAELSTGPRTEAGKERSRQNALKHGLSGGSVVLPAEEAAAITTRMNEWAAALEPRNPREVWLTSLAAVESVRIDSAQRHEIVLRGLQTSRARLCWDDDRRLAAEQLALRLPHEPTVVARQLQQTPQGCDLLIERWQQLAEAADLTGSWTDAQRALALDLLGTPPALRENDPRFDAEDLESCLELARDQVAQLEQRKREVLAELDDQERSAAELGLGTELSPPLTLVRRYLAASMRRLQWACTQLLLARPERASVFHALRPGAAVAIVQSVEPPATPAPADPAGAAAAVRQLTSSPPQPPAPKPAADEPAVAERTAEAVAAAAEVRVPIAPIAGPEFRQSSVPGRPEPARELEPEPEPASEPGPGVEAPGRRDQQPR